MFACLPVCLFVVVCVWCLWLSAYCVVCMSALCRSDRCCMMCRSCDRRHCTFGSQPPAPAGLGLSARVELRHLRWTCRWHDAERQPSEFACKSGRRRCGRERRRHEREQWQQLCSVSGAAAGRTTALGQLFAPLQRLCGFYTEQSQRSRTHCRQRVGAYAAARYLHLPSLPELSLRQQRQDSGQR